MSAVPIPVVTLRLQLYLAGPPHPACPTLTALDQLRRLGYVIELEVIDIRSDPQRAEADRVIATPTLAKLHPLPMRRVMGDLADVQRLMQLLQIS
ncbi:MAG: hypothetical protein RL404_2388 [Pseudomonadota bacterium]|jgi:circadian clock protein KaiB